MSSPKGPEPLVTVITPTFNRAELLRHTLISIREQDWERFELIVVDDGSTDHTIAVLEELEPSFGGRLRWMSQPNGGEARAVNRGWAAALGEYVFVISSDDPQPAELLSTSVDFMQRHPSVIVCYPDWVKIDANGNRLETVQSPDFDEAEFFVSMRCPPGPGACIRREPVMAIRTDLRRPDQVIANDLEAWMTIAAHGKLERLPKAVAMYRVHGTSATLLTNDVSWQSGRVGLAYEFYSRSDLPDRVRQYEDQCKRRQIALLVHAAFRERAGSRFASLAALALVYGPRGVSRRLLRRLGRRLGSRE